MTQKSSKAFKHARSLPIVIDVISLLEQRLPADVRYHSVTHTVDVLETALDLAISAGISGRDLEILAIAAAFHDSGFIEGQQNHELVGARFAAATMHSTGEFTDDEIDLVKTLILDTRLIENHVGVRQHPSTELGCYLLDADLANFGRDDFFEKLELQKEESGTQYPLALRQALEMLENHRWHTDIANLRFQSRKEQNVTELKTRLKEYQQTARPKLKSLSTKRLEYLTRLSLLLNSSLHLRQVLSLALETIKQELKAEAASVLLLDQSGERLTFWALKGGAAQQLENKQMLSDRGIAGWVIANQLPLLVADAHNDPRFYQAIDQELGFTTRNMLCVPLTARRQTPLGAIQVINSTDATTFTEEDQCFLEQFSSQAALVIENVNLRETIQARNSRLEEISQKKDQLIGLIGNSLLEPIDQIMKTCHQLPNSKTDQQQTLLETLDSNCQEVKELVERVRLLAQLDSNELLPNLSHIQLASLFDYLHEKFSSIAKNKGITLQSDISTKTGEILVDPELMTIAIGNLIQNAIDATPSSGRVLLHAGVTGELVHIEITDTGVGISSHELPLLFDKFYQTKASLGLNQSKLTSCKRLGIGLPIAQGIIRAHGSVLEVKSTPQEGSTFYFTLRVNTKLQRDNNY